MIPIPRRAACERREEAHDVPLAEPVVGRDVLTVDERHPRELGRDGEGAGGVFHGTPRGEVEGDDVLGAERAKGREEVDVDPHRKPPWLAVATAGPRSATSRRSPGRISWSGARRFQRSTSATETP